MSRHEWVVIGSFGALTGALALFDGKLALEVIGLAALIVIVRNADKLPLPTKG